MSTSIKFLCAVTLLAFGVGSVSAQPKKVRYAKQSDLDRLEKRLEEQRVLISKLIALQQQYLTQITALTSDPAAPIAPPVVATAATTSTKALAPADSPAPVPAVVARPEPPRTERKKPAAATPGSIVGRVKGGGDAIVYLDVPGSSVSASATMKQEGKQFAPRVLVVQKGTTVSFPNMDAVFHNVFSVTPDNSFDLGSYRKGESKSVVMTKTGVVTVYCNMHPQMVGHVLVVPSPMYTRVGSDGFFKLANVPPGNYKIVVWAPNAKPVTSDVSVGDAEVATVELQVGARRAGPHTNKDGMAYGSYKD
jgi:plastocyanin